MDLIAAADTARQAGAVFGRLLIPLIGIVLIVLGRRKKAAAQRSPVPRSSGKALVIIGWVLVVLGVLGALAAVSTAP
jgi:Na+-translocating ferredoxin:NAD+ oxidoreductase RnfE subunit